jgi:hypothetical protein
MAPEIKALGFPNAETESPTASGSGYRNLEARVRIELTMEVLQTSALPLGYRAPQAKTTRQQKARATAGLEKLERETGFEPATSTLARSHSTTELLPLELLEYK